MNAVVRMYDNYTHDVNSDDVMDVDTDTDEWTNKCTCTCVRAQNTTKTQ
jgi:hypothetical protein